MPHNLNKITPTTGVVEVARYTKYLEAKLQTTPGSTHIEKERYFSLLGQLSLWLGLYSYMLDASEMTIKTHFSRSAGAFIQMFGFRPEPTPETGSREMRRFEQTLALTICFGQQDLTQGLDSIRPWAYRHPIRPEETGYFLYLEALRNVIVHANFDPNTMNQLLSSFKDGPGTITPNVSISSQALALSALSKNDAQNFNQHLASVVSHHEIDARRGALSDSQEGFICLEGMALAGLAKRFHVSITISSPYLPIHLIALQ